MIYDSSPKPIISCTWCVGPKVERNREQLVGIYRVGGDSSQYGETVPHDGQHNGRHVGPLEVWGILSDVTQWEGTCWAGERSGTIPLLGQ